MYVDLQKAGLVEGAIKQSEQTLDNTDVSESRKYATQARVNEEKHT